MRGVYTIFQEKNGLNRHDVSHLAKTAQARGIDSAGLVVQAEKYIQVKKRDYGSVSAYLGKSGRQIDSWGF